MCAIICYEMSRALCDTCRVRGSLVIGIMIRSRSKGGRLACRAKAEVFEFLGLVVYIFSLVVSWA